MHQPNFKVSLISSIALFCQSSVQDSLPDARPFPYAHMMRMRIPS